MSLRKKMFFSKSYNVLSLTLFFFIVRLMILVALDLFIHSVNFNVCNININLKPLLKFNLQSNLLKKLNPIWLRSVINENKFALRVF